jgi:hypothetical protein
MAFPPFPVTCERSLGSERAFLPVQAQPLPTCHSYIFSGAECFFAG